MFEWYSIRVPNKHIIMFNQILKKTFDKPLFSSVFGESMKIALEYQPKVWKSDNLVTPGPSWTVLSLSNTKKGRVVTERQFAWTMHTLFSGELFQNRLSRLARSLLKIVLDHAANSSVIQSWLGKAMNVKIWILRHSRRLLKKYYFSYVKIIQYVHSIQIVD